MTDLRFAFRQLLKNPVFTVVAVLTLALGIGANTAIFSLIDHVMLRLLPVRNPEEMMVVPGQFTYPQYERVRDLNSAFSGIFGLHALPDMEVTVAGEPPTQATGALVSGSYFPVLEVEAMLGRILGPEDDRAPLSSPVAVISHSYWKRAFGGAADVLGKTIRVRSSAGYASTGGLDIYDGTAGSPEGASLTIVGVARPGFFGATLDNPTDIWIPMMMEPAVMPGRPWLAKNNASWVTIMGRKKPGLSQQEISAALTVLWRQILTDEAGSTLTDDRKRSIAQQSLKAEPGGKGFSHLRNQFSQPLRILMAVVASVLLIACLNVANLLLVRSTARQHEISVRLALGAKRGRLLRQLLTESLLLGALGGVLGLGVAFVVERILVVLVLGESSLLLSIHPDGRMLAFTAAISLLTTVVFGLFPAWRATRVGLANALKATSRTTADRQRGSAAKVLVAVQVAVSMILLIGAGLFVRTLFHFKSQDVGYAPENLVILGLDPVSAGYKGDDIGRVCQRILDRIRILPGVRAATFSENGLFFGPESGTRVQVEGFTSTTVEDQRCRFDQVGPNYFSKIGIPLLLGREITERDDPTAPRVTVINESMAKFYFAGGSPIGKQIRTRVGNQDFQLEIVGVARDVQDHSLKWKPVRRFYVSYFQPIDGITGANFEIRTIGHLPNLAKQLRQEIQAVDRNLTVLGLRDVRGLMDQSVIQERLIAQLSAAFGLLAVLLAAIGLYGVMAYEVVRRTNEIGIRLALGAQRVTVLQLILKNGMRLTLLGMLIGLGSAIPLTRLIQSQLHGVKALDPLTFVLVTVGLILVAALACYLPARRATKIDPMEALRYE